MRTFYEAARPLYPLFSLFLISSAWACFSHNKILEYDPRMFFMMTGTIFSNISCRLIVAQMSDTRTDAWNFQLTLLSFATIICIFPYQLLKFPTPQPTFEISVLYGLACVTSLLHFHYGICVVSIQVTKLNVINSSIFSSNFQVREMCGHLKIKCFKVSSYTSLVHEKA